MKKVLFIGNQATPILTICLRWSRSLPTRPGEELHVTMLTKGGMDFAWHQKQEQTAFNLRYGGYDFCVLQQAAHSFSRAGGTLRGDKGNL